MSLGNIINFWSTPDIPVMVTSSSERNDLSENFYDYIWYTIYDMISFTFFFVELYNQYIISNKFWKTCWLLSPANGFWSHITSFNSQGSTSMKRFRFLNPHKHNTYVKVVVTFLRESLQMKDFTVCLKCVICGTEICKNPPSLLMLDLNFSFKCRWFASKIQDYLI